MFRDSLRNIFGGRKKLAEGENPIQKIIPSKTSEEAIKQETSDYLQELRQKSLDEEGRQRKRTIAAKNDVAVRLAQSDAELAELRALLNLPNSEEEPHSIVESKKRLIRLDNQLSQDNRLGQQAVLEKSKHDRLEDILETTTDDLNEIYNSSVIEGSIYTFSVEYFNTEPPGTFTISIEAEYRASYGLEAENPEGRIKLTFIPETNGLKFQNESSLDAKTLNVVKGILKLKCQQIGVIFEE